MKKIVALFSFLVVILLIPFCWKENLNLTKKINDEKVANFFSSIGALAAAISIYILFRQLIAINYARKAANQPDLYPSFARFQAKDVFEQSFFEQHDKPSVVIQMIGDKGTPQHIPPYIDLCNIGLGAAKNISLLWKYNIQEIQGLIRNHYQSLKPNETESEHIDFLQANGKVSVDIPMFYFSSCGEKLNSDLLDLLASATKEPKPSLVLNISYQDIENNWYNKHFKAQIQAFKSNVSVKFHSVEIEDGSN